MFEQFEKWCQLFETKKKTSTVPLPETVARSYLMATFFDMKEPKPVLPDEVKNEFAYKLVVGRAKFLNLNVTDGVVLFLSVAVRSPGDAVMLLSYLKWKSVQQNYSVIDMEQFAFIFPLGMLSEKAMSDLWDAQKITRSEGMLNDNLLDVSFYGK